MNNKTHGKVNIVSDQEFKSKLQDIVDTCAEIVGNTIGPYGQNTLLQTSDGIIKTKDGWNVLKGLKFNTIVDNSIKGVIEEIASQVVLKVGDGSTTSILAAAYMNQLLGKELEELGEFLNISTRELDSALRYGVNKIITQLNKMSTKIESEDIKEFMYKIALVSTNWDEDTATMISNIIAETNNPVIKTEYSGTDNTEITIVSDAYDVAGELVEKMFINNNETSSCDLSHPTVLVFDHTVKEDYIPALLTMYAEISREQGQSLIVMAPEFSDTFKTEYNKYLMMSIRQSGGMPSLVPVKYIRATNFDRLCIKDFAMMCGGSLVTKSEDLTNLTKELYSKEPSEDSYVELIALLTPSMGKCGSISITNKLITISGLHNRKEEEYQRVLSAAANGLGEKLKEHTAMSMLTDDVKLRKYRYGKLQCKMGSIKLGGFGQADLKAKKDALDDAILACEAAYYHGYNIGSSMAVPVACKALLLSPDEDFTILQGRIISIIGEAFENVFKRIVSHKCDIEKYRGSINEQGNGLSIGLIITECITKGIGYNLITDEFDTNKDIINPTTTDIEILKGMLNITLMNFTSNQFLFKHFEEDMM